MAHETVRLAEYAAALRYEDLPASVVQQAVPAASDCLIVRQPGKSLLKDDLP